MPACRGRPEGAELRHGIDVPIDHVQPRTRRGGPLGQHRRDGIERGILRLPGPIERPDVVVAVAQIPAEAGDGEPVAGPPAAMVVMRAGYHVGPAVWRAGGIERLAISARGAKPHELDHAAVPVTIGKRLDESIDPGTQLRIPKRSDLRLLPVFQANIAREAVRLAIPLRQAIRRTGNQHRSPFQPGGLEDLHLPIPTAPVPAAFGRVFHRLPRDIRLDAGESQGADQGRFRRNGVAAHIEFHPWAGRHANLVQHGRVDAAGTIISRPGERHFELSYRPSPAHEPEIGPAVLAVSEAGVGQADHAPPPRLAADGEKHVFRARIKAVLRAIDRRLVVFQPDQARPVVEKLDRHVGIVVPGPDLLLVGLDIHVMRSLARDPPAGTSARRFGRVGAVAAAGDGEPIFPVRGA